jgi:hypothetical protein
MVVMFPIFISARVSLYSKTCHVLLTPSAAAIPVYFPTYTNSLSLTHTHTHTHNNVCPHRFSSPVSLNPFCLFTCCFALYPTEVSTHPLRQPHKFCCGSFPTSSAFLIMSISNVCPVRCCYCPHFFLSFNVTVCSTLSSV